MRVLSFTVAAPFSLVKTTLSKTAGHGRISSGALWFPSLVLLLPVLLGTCRAGILAPQFSLQVGQQRPQVGETAPLFRPGLLQAEAPRTGLAGTVAPDFPTAQQVGAVARWPVVSLHTPHFAFRCL
jgi:hypothetical protein